MTTPVVHTTGLTSGDLRLYDNDIPALNAGTYYVEVAQTLDHAGAPVAPEALGARQSFMVTAPQFRIDPAMVRSAYPPAESSGRYGTVLPYVVLADPLLPFERPMPGPAAEHQPWLAVLVFSPGELSGGGDSPTAVTTTTVEAFLKPAAGRRIPDVTRSPDVKPTDPCTYISVPAPVFRNVAPRLNELRFLAHCRHAAVDDQVVTGSPAPQDSPGEALTSVIVANRFASAAIPGAPAVRGIAHLVSLEGLGPLLDGGSALKDDETVSMISLYSWSFWSFDDGDGDFESLARGVVTRRDAHGQAVPADLLLRLPVPAMGSGPGPHSGPEHLEVSNRLSDGYVPLEYRTPTGESTFAWYRGPLSPVPGMPAPQRFRSADAARAFDPAYGVFDLSLAAAWQAGRAAALADPAFGRLLLDFRRRTHGLVDALYQRLDSDHFSADQIAHLDLSTTAQNDFLAILTAQLLADAGRGPQPSAPPAPKPAGPPPPPDADPQAALQAFLAEPEVHSLILAAVREDLDPIATWLARLLLLEHVPFAHLVPDEGMLPQESLRFGYLDPAWQDAMLDGALSLGIESSLRALYASLTGDLVRSAAREAALVRRSDLLGIPVPPQPSFPVTDASSVTTGLLVRSALVAGWPDLAIRARDAESAPIPALRISRLSPTVLLCLFSGIPTTVTLGEPPQGLRFGVEDSGHVPLRSPQAGGVGKPPLGAILTGVPAVPVLDPTGKAALALRDVRTRVLNLDPRAPESLVGRLTAALDAALPDSARVLGPADVALQMIKSPEALLIGTPAAGPEAVRA